MELEDEIKNLIEEFKIEISQSSNKLGLLYSANILDFIIAKLENRVGSKFRLEAIKISEYLKIKK